MKNRVLCFQCKKREKSENDLHFHLCTAVYASWHSLKCLRQSTLQMAALKKRNGILYRFWPMQNLLIYTLDNSKKKITYVVIMSSFSETVAIPRKLIHCNEIKLRNPMLNVSFKKSYLKIPIDLFLANL